MADSTAEGQYLSVADLVQMTKGSPDTINAPSLADYRMTQEMAQPGAHKLPENHPIRVLVKNSGGSATHKPHLRNDQLPSQVLLKRKEFEQDLDNGDTSDFLRLPY